jgi:hypothetical protein
MIEFRGRNQPFAAGVLIPPPAKPRLVRWRDPLAAARNLRTQQLKGNPARMNVNTALNAEAARLRDTAGPESPWRLWGPYLSERQWGTVREDYSANGDAWRYFPHEDARSRAYRWGEDGLAGISDVNCRLCLSLALWNGRDPILKERLFGLENQEGNHGEDVKECYYYLDATPTHSYLKMLYKYPQREFPYAQLLEENRRRGRDQSEFELLDTGVFDDNRYFDVWVEYGKASPDDVLMLVTAHNRGPEPAVLHLLPQLWFRNTWSWAKTSEARPTLAAESKQSVVARHPRLGEYHWYANTAGELLFCDNDSDGQRLFGLRGEGYFKDAIHEYVVGGQQEAVNPDRQGTKAAAHYVLKIPPSGAGVIRLRLSRVPLEWPLENFDAVLSDRRREADVFYATLQSEIPDPDARQVQRQALAGMIWNKQFYLYDVDRWLKGDPLQPAPPDERLEGRNNEWTHLNNEDVLSMPDKWEYPWFAAWDLAFHCIPLALVDPEFAKSQLVLLTREWYMNPNGQLPAYEWAFGDVNPPVHAWAAWRVFQIDRKRSGGPGDLAFLERVMHKLMLNFTWWVNRKDSHGRSVFQGGFLGLDNIGVFDRSQPLPGGGYLSQADATSWMAMYSLNLLRMALELSLHNHVYEDIATKFLEHFLQIAAAINNEQWGLWDPTDEFYYDKIHLPDSRSITLQIRSIVGLIPLFAVETLEPEMLERLPGFTTRLKWYLKHRPDLAELVSRWDAPGRGERRLLSLLRGHRMKCLLRRTLDESEFLSDYGVRSLSRYHKDHPYVFNCHGSNNTVRYQPGDSDSGMFGGNSNWRGPIWFPINFLLIESLQKFHHYYGDDFQIECPTGSGRNLSIAQVADELSRRLTKLFLRDAAGERPLHRHSPRERNDPHFRDHVLFHEYFHGDDGHGLGAEHQTGWTGLVAKLLQPRRP